MTYAGVGFLSEDPLNVFHSNIFFFRMFYYLEDRLTACVFLLTGWCCGPVDLHLLKKENEQRVGKETNVKQRRAVDDRKVLFCHKIFSHHFHLMRTSFSELHIDH